MKMIRNMALRFGGKFYATQGGPLRPGYSVSEAKVPTDWETRVETNYPQRLTKDTMQFTLLDSDACGITGLLSDFNPDAADAMCAKELTLFTVIGDETSGAECDTDGTNMGTLFARSANAYVVNAQPSSVTVEGERIETLTVTFRTTTPFAAVSPITALAINVYLETVENADESDLLGGEATPTTLAMLYGTDMPDVVSEASDPVVATETVVAAGVSVGKTYLGLADCNGKLYYNAPVAPSKAYTPVEAKFDRLVPIKLYYKFSA